MNDALPTPIDVKLMNATATLLFVAFVLDKPAAPAHDDQTQAIGAARGVIR